MYYVSKRLLNVETRYPELEKFVLALIIASRKLRSYFHAKAIEVLTNYPQRQVLQKPEVSERLFKSAIELGQFDINYRPQTIIKGQALVDFIAEVTYSNTTEEAGTTNNVEATKEVEMKRDGEPTKRLEDSDLNGE